MWLQTGVWIAGGSTTNAETCTEHEERHGFKPVWGLCKFGWIVFFSICLLPGKLIVAEKDKLLYVYLILGFSQLEIR